MNAVTVEADWVKDHLSEITVLDCSWHLNRNDADPRDEYLAAHIPGAVYLDVDDVAAQEGVRCIMPSKEKFAAKLGALGLDGSEEVVVMDNGGMIAAASRGYVMLKHYGHRGPVHILNGGLITWNNKGYPTEAGPVAVEAKTYTTGPSHPLLMDLPAVQAALPETAIIDMRFSKMYDAGHIPGALNLGGSALLTEDKRLKPAADVIALLEKAGVSIDKPLISYCGFGLVSSLLVVLHDHIAAEMPDTPLGEWCVFDDSLAGWKPKGLPVEQTK